MYFDVLVMILAGGEGSRLRPLTNDRAKPAVPFGGRYRLVDFVLSNFVNSGFFRIKVLTQYKSESLNQHIMRGWRLATILDQYVEVVPAQQRRGKQWYVGSADAIHQNLNLIADAKPKQVCIFGADNIYNMDVSQMLEEHRDKGSKLSIATIPVPIEEASAFGVVEVNEEGRIIDFHEKPKNPPPMPGNPAMSLVSMGNYIFDTEVLVEQILRDSADVNSVHDFGKSIITYMVKKTDIPCYAYDFSTNKVPGQSAEQSGYWRDVGTIRSYWQTSMDLVAVTPEYNLYNTEWPVRSHHKQFPPAKFVHDEPNNARVGKAINSIVSEGVIVSGGTIRQSILFPSVRINSYSSVEESIIFSRVNIGRNVRIRRAIIDKDVDIPEGTQIGYDLEKDRKRFTVSDGIVVVPKGTKF